MSDDLVEILFPILFSVCRIFSGQLPYRSARGVGVNPFRAPEPLPILNPSNFVPKKGFPVVKGLRLGYMAFLSRIPCHDIGTTRGSQKVRTTDLPTDTVGSNRP